VDGALSINGQLDMLSVFSAAYSVNSNETVFVEFDAQITSGYGPLLYSIFSEDGQMIAGSWMNVLKSSLSELLTSSQGKEMTCSKSGELDDISFHSILLDGINSLNRGFSLVEFTMEEGIEYYICVNTGFFNEFPYSLTLNVI